MLKAELRRLYLEKRRALGAAERRAQSERLAARFFDAFDPGRIDCLHLFLPIERFAEIDTRLILERLWAEHPRVETLVPRVDFARGELENRRLAPGAPLVESAWGIAEPADGPAIAPEKIDLVLVPLLACDARGYRVGYGKGFYDKLLARCRKDCVKVGISSFPPVEKIADIDAYDVPLDFCLTPDETIEF